MSKINNVVKSIKVLKSILGEDENSVVAGTGGLRLLTGLADAQELCHQLASRSGWWSDLKTGERLKPEQVNIGEKLCLVHSEVSEAMEGARKGLMDDHLPHRKMIEVELADAVIRILDLAGYLDLDIAGAVIEKLAYNQQRADHKLDNRRAEGGKAF